MALDDVSHRWAPPSVFGEAAQPGCNWRRGLRGLSDWLEHGLNHREEFEVRCTPPRLPGNGFAHTGRGDARGMAAAQ